MRPATSAVILCAFGAVLLTTGLATAGNPKDPASLAREEAQQLRETILKRLKGSSPKRIEELMGAPSRRAPHDGGDLLEWTAGSAGGSEGTCSLSAQFSEGKLADIGLPAPEAWDKKACKRLARPLVNAMPSGTAGGDLLTLTNDDVVQMVKDGMPAQAIIAKIKNSACKFDVSFDATSSLRRSGVGEAIIQAMIDKGSS